MMENVPTPLFEAGHDSCGYIVVARSKVGMVARPIFDDSQRQTLCLSPQRLLFNLLLFIWNIDQGTAKGTFFSKLFEGDGLVTY